jgi:serine/threonine-protein kinase RsbW
VTPVRSCTRRLQAPALPASLDAVQDLVEELLDGDDQLTPADRIRFETAVAEIAGNVIQHAVPAPGAALVTLTVEVSSDHAVIRASFVDDGQEVDVDLEAAGMPDEADEQGRGLAMVRSLSDVLRYERSGATNRWTVECRRTPSG